MSQTAADNTDAPASLVPALPTYEQTLLELAERDAERAVENPDERASRSVALWMADQVAERARQADLDPAFARVMQEQAKRIREKVLSAPQPAAARRW